MNRNVLRRGEIREDLRDKYRGFDALNISTLKQGLKSMAHVLAAMHTESTPTPQMALGTAVHAKLLRPKQYDDLVAVMPNVDRRTKEGKALYQQFVEQSSGKTVIDHEQAGLVAVLERSAWDDPEIHDMLAQLSHAEAPIFWGEPKPGTTAANDTIPAKAQIDGYDEQRRLLIDIKTTSSAHPKAVEAAIYNYGYHLQAEWYERAVEAAFGQRPEPMRFVFLETVEPYLTMVVELDRETREIARLEVDRLLSMYTACKKAGIWPGYASGVQTLGIPLWARKQFEEAPVVQADTEGGAW